MAPWMARWNTAWVRAALGVCVVLGCTPVALRAADPQAQISENLENNVRVIRKGSSAKAARLAAANALPLDKLTEQNRQRALAVINSTSVFRDLPTLEFEVEPAVYEFFRAHPDVAVSIWRAMDISKFQMWQTGREEYESDAGDGSTGILTALYVGGPHSVVMCDGVYKSPFLTKPIKATALLHIETTYERRADKKTYVRHGGHLFVNFPSQTVDTAAKIISPVSNLIIDRNFHEVSLFVHMMSLAMVRQPGWVEHIAGKLEGVLEVRKGQLLDVTAKVYVDAHKREPGAAGVSWEKVVEPLRHSPAGAAAPQRAAAHNALPPGSQPARPGEKTASAGAAPEVDPNLVLRVPRDAFGTKSAAAEPKKETAVK